MSFRILPGKGEGDTQSHRPQLRGGGCELQSRPCRPGPLQCAGRGAVQPSEAQVCRGGPEAPAHDRSKSRRPSAFSKSAFLCSLCLPSSHKRHAGNVSPSKTVKQVSLSRSLTSSEYHPFRLFHPHPPCIKSPSSASYQRKPVEGQVTMAQVVPLVQTAGLFLLLLLLLTVQCYIESMSAGGAPDQASV